jgi:hypothetical protein
LVDLLEFDSLEDAFPFLHNLLEDFLPLPERILHEIDLFTILFEPKDVKDHEAKLVLIRILIEGDYLIHTECSHLVRLSLNDDDFSIEDALLGHNQFIYQLNEGFVKLGVVYCVSGEEFDLVFAFMDLESFSVVLGLNIVGYVLVLSEETDLLLAGKHGPDGEEDLDLIVERHVGIFEFFADLQKTVGQVEKVTPVFVEGIEDGINFDTDFQILEYDPDDPFDLLSIGDSEQPPEDRNMVLGGGHEFIEYVVQLVDGKHRYFLAVALYDIMGAE